MSDEAPEPNPLKLPPPVQKTLTPKPRAAGSSFLPAVQDSASASRRAELKNLYMTESGEVEQEVIEIAARDVERHPHHEERLAKEKETKKESFYSDLLYTLTHLRYDEQEARVLWVNLLTHKMEMSDRLDRNVGIRVAALDYFKNILGALDEVKIMDASSYIETAQLAVTDGLTGVFNHRYFQDRLLRDINRAREENLSLSLLMIDIDYFKQYNDINGHIAGDVALKEVGAVLRSNLKKDDLVARYGGEEFAVILAGLVREQAKHVAERIRTVLAGMAFPNEKVLPGGNLTISIGLAECPRDATERGELIAAADRALYKAKRSGRNRVEVSQADQRRELRLTRSMRVVCRIANQIDAKPVEATMSNISTGGVCLDLPTQAAVGEVYHLDLDGTGGDAPVLGRVVWQVTQPSGTSKIGVKFVNLHPKDSARFHKIVDVSP